MHGVEFWKKWARKEAVRLLDVLYQPQSDDDSCGPACLRMIYDFYKICSRIFPGSTHNGTPGRLMIECITQSGLTPEIPPHRMSDRDLKEVLRLIDDGKPAIMAIAAIAPLRQVPTTRCWSATPPRSCSSTIPSSAPTSPVLDAPSARSGSKSATGTSVLAAILISTFSPPERRCG